MSNAQTSMDKIILAELLYYIEEMNERIGNTDKSDLPVLFLKPGIVDYKVDSTNKDAYIYDRGISRRETRVEVKKFIVRSIPNIGFGVIEPKIWVVLTSDKAEFIVPFDEADARIDNWDDFINSLDPIDDDMDE